MAARGNTARTSRTRRLRYWVGGFALLAAVGTAASAFGSGPDPSGNTTTTSSADPSAAPSPSPSTTSPADPSASPTAEPSPVVTYRLERHRTSIAFATKNVKTAALDKGVTRVKQPGRRGVRVTVYRLTFTDGVQTRRQLVDRHVARRPVPRIVLHGTYVKPKPKPSNTCDPNYSGCVPIASDVDCAGGSGNGPAYVVGPVRVIGTDIYGLDSDGDGWGCES